MVAGFGQAGRLMGSVLMEHASGDDAPGVLGVHLTFSSWAPLVDMTGSERTRVFGDGWDGT